jgi:hypothetical protein
MRALFARYRVALYRWLLRLVDDGTLAEDLLSEVFLDVWRQAASFEARSSVSTWLLAIYGQRPCAPANRPNTLLHRPACKREEKPCQLGAVHTWHKAAVGCEAIIWSLFEAEQTTSGVGRKVENAPDATSTARNDRSAS